MLNIVTIHAIRKTPSLSKNLKALLLSQAVCDLGVGLLAQPMYVARLIMESKLNSGTNSSYNAIYIAYLVPDQFIYSRYVVSHCCSVRWEIYLSVRRHVNQIQVLQLQQASHNGQMANIKRMRRFAIMAVYVCLVLLVCYLPNGFTLFVTALSGSNTGINHVQHYTLTLELLHSSLNPLIYCWKMKHVRHTVIGILRNALKLSKHR